MLGVSFACDRHACIPRFLFLFLILLVLCLHVSPFVSAEGSDALAWSNDPEWYNEAQTSASPSGRFSNHPLTTAQFIGIAFQALFPRPLHHHRLFTTSHDVPSSITLNASPEWFLVNDPEFFNENLARPHADRPSHCVFSRRMLLKTQSASSRKLVPTSSSSRKLFNWFAASSQTVEDVDK